jgi:hypothetical protein
VTTEQLTETAGGATAGDPHPAGGTAGATGEGASTRARPSASATTASSKRAYERRQRRHQKITAARLVGPGKPIATALDRAPFVVVLIGLLAGGIAAVLYLNTVTDEAGMRTSTAKSNATDLRLTIEALQRDVALLDATPKIADEAAALGMVPAGDSAMLIVDAAGTGSVVGTPSAVPGAAPPAAPVDPAAEAAAASAAAAAAATSPVAATTAPAPPADPAAPVDPAAPADPAAAQAAADAAAAQAATQAAADAAAAQAAAEAAAQAQAQAQAGAAAAGTIQAAPVDPNAPAEGVHQ